VGLYIRRTRKILGLFSNRL